MDELVGAAAVVVCAALEACPLHCPLKASRMRPDHSGDVDHRIGILDQQLERSAVMKVAEALHSLSLRLLAAGERHDVVTRGDGGLEQMGADEPGTAGDRNTR